MRLRRILIADLPSRRRDPDLILWLGDRPVPPDMADGKLVLYPSSLRAAARYVVGAAPAVLQLALAEPLEFMTLLAEVRRSPALRAA
jgi:hypothetical protein